MKVVFEVRESDYGDNFRIKLSEKVGFSVSECSEFTIHLLVKNVL